MNDQFPRPPRDEPEREACENGARLRRSPNGTPMCGALSDDGEGYKCTRPPHSDGTHVSTGNGKVLATWPDAPIVEPAAPTLRGVAWHRFEDGGMSVAVAGDAYGRADGQRFLHLSPDEARGMDQNDNVTIKIEVTRE